MILIGGWFVDIVGICTGNTLWLLGLISVGIGIWGLKVKKESILKASSMMSMMTGGKPVGFALKLKGLVDPTDRRREFGNKMLILGGVLLIIGASLIRGCTN